MQQSAPRIRLQMQGLREQFYDLLGLTENLLVKGGFSIQSSTFKSLPTSIHTSKKTSSHSWKLPGYSEDIPELYLRYT